MNCTWNLYLHKCRPSLCPHCFSGSRLVWVCLPFLLLASTELIPFYLPNLVLPSEPGCSHGNGLKRTNCFCKKSLLFSQCFSCLREASSEFLSGNHGLDTEHFLCIYWNRSCSSGYHRHFAACLAFFFLTTSPAVEEEPLLFICFCGFVVGTLRGGLAVVAGAQVCSRHNVHINQYLVPPSLMHI